MTGWQPTPARGASAFLARQFGGPSGLAGIDPSPVARKSARCRNAAAIKAGRLALMTGDAKAAVAFGPADLIVACHILYFWALATDLIVARAAVAARVEFGGLDMRHLPVDSAAWTLTHAAGFFRNPANKNVF